MQKKLWGNPGIEPEISRTLSECITTLPIPLILDVRIYYSFGFTLISLPKSTFLPIYKNVQYHRVTAETSGTGSHPFNGIFVSDSDTRDVTRSFTDQNSQEPARQFRAIIAHHAAMLYQIRNIPGRVVGHEDPCRSLQSGNFCNLSSQMGNCESDWYDCYWLATLSSWLKTRTLRTHRGKLPLNLGMWYSNTSLGLAWYKTIIK